MLPERSSLLILAAAGFAAAMGCLYLFDPSAHTFYPRCPLKLFTGFDCPGCGTLRSLHQAMHGNFSAVLHLNPALIPGAAVIFGLLVSPRFRENVWTPRIVLVCLIAYGVLRNVPVWPFTLMAVH